MATTLTAGGLAAELRVAIARTARRLRQEAAAGLSATLLAGLATVERHGPLTPSELAVRESIQRPTATKLINRLVAEGLVLRTGDPSDGRSSLITVTAAGRTRLREARQRKDVFLSQRLRALSGDDRETLARAAVLLERLLEDAA